MAADALAPSVARTSATMILTVPDSQVLVFLEEEFDNLRYLSDEKW